MDNPLVTIELWGDFALWTRPESKVERVTYPVPTPSGMRGVLSSIYAKPPEFYWQVHSIEVLRPIRYATFRRNEVKSKMVRIPAADPLSACISIEDDRTQRQSVVLRDVRYRVSAEIVPRPEYRGPAKHLYDQFERRARRGQAFMQPSLGTREFVAYFEWGNSGEPPISESMDLGLMVYDTFDLHQWKVTPKAMPLVSLFRARLENGVLTIPPFDSPLVLKPKQGGGEHA